MPFSQSALGLRKLWLTRTRATSPETWIWTSVSRVGTG